MTTRASAILASVLCVLLGASAAHAQSGCGNANAPSCLQVHGAGGCNNAACCNTVCGFSPDCCLVAWDEVCVELANQNCPTLCGASSAGDCRVAHANPACNDEACCTLVCTLDPACCQFDWDFLCAFQAEQNCAPPPPVECGAAGSGSCTTPHGTPACSDTACCNLICGLDPTCCTQSWDFICVQLALTYCGGCNLTCPAASTLENESCNVRANDACISGQVPEPITCGMTVCGTIDGQMEQGLWAGDRDAYSFTAVDTNGDGQVKLTLRLASEFPAFAALVPASCPVVLTSSPLHVNASNCLQQSVSACVPPGNYWILVTAGTYPTASSSQPLDCLIDPRYSLVLECAQAGCGPVCGVPSAGSCYAQHSTPGCDDATCCNLVCSADPYCCSVAWDAECVASAGSNCGLPAPANDDCSNAAPIATGATVQFNTAGATVSAPTLPPQCEQGEGIAIGRDIWFSYTATCSGNLAISTCGSATDLRLVVYTGSCGELQWVACDTDNILCQPVGGARVQFTATCGQTYLIRVGGDSSAQLGPGQLTVTCPGPACPSNCPQDLDGSGVVDGTDLGLLLGAWNTTGPGDIDNSGVVDGTDLGLLLGAWGPCGG